MATFTVTTLNDENDAGANVDSPGGSGLSLREAIALANANGGLDTICFAPALSGGTIRLGSTLTITDKLVIDGDGDILDGGFPNILITGDAFGNDTLTVGLTDIAASQTAGTLGDNVQLFAATAALTLEGLILTGGSAAGSGGAVSALDGLTLSYAVVSGNMAGTDGGGIWASSAEISNATISGNSAGNSGGGVGSDGSVGLFYATISGNSAGAFGGGIAVAAAALTNATVSGNRAVTVGYGINANHTTLTNSIVLGNGTTNTDEAAGPLDLTGGNIVGTNVYSGSTDIGDTAASDVFLAVDATTGGGLLAYDGGRTPTIALKDSPFNPAIDASDNSLSTFWLPFDHPDVPNVNGSPRDLGAAELFSAGGGPKNFLPGAQSVEANTDSAISGMSVQDPDPGSGVLTTTLSVLHGKLTITASGGASISGNGTPTVALSGTVSQINAALATDSLTYRGDPDYFGTDTLTMLTDDNGSGTSASHTDTDQITIKVQSLLTGTSGDDSFAALPGNARIDARGGIDTVTFDFKLTDATVSYVDNTVIIDGPSSHTVLTGVETFVFTDGTVNNNDGNWLLDDLFYYSHNHDVWNAHADADSHFDATGWHEGRDPSAFFSTTIYLSANPDVKAAGVNPLLHFDQFGWREGRVASLTFDPLEYLANYADVAAARIDPLAHFLQHGAGEGRHPFPPPSELITANGFDYVYYLQHNPDVAAAGVDPFRHFMTVGWTEGRDPNALFDVNGYLANYADVQAAGVNPLEHYNQFGWHEGRDPSVGFDTTSYLAAYPDVQAAQVNPLIHYLQFGGHEGRSPFADGLWG
jgi:hypothetical protein